MQDTLMNQGIELMVFGMGTVFVFLTLLVVMTILMSSLLQKFAPETPAPHAKPAHSAQPTSAMDDPQLVAVISAAIKAHRSNQK